MLAFSKTLINFHNLAFKKFYRHDYLILIISQFEHKWYSEIIFLGLLGKENTMILKNGKIVLFLSISKSSLYFYPQCPILNDIPN